jgi:4-amino-4-deoxy-L-arabinose transferase-like glycosyltransferase
MGDTPLGVSRRLDLWHATLGLICLVAFCLAALISQAIFERIPHVEDEAAYLFQAQVFAQGKLSVPTPPYPVSYWSPFVVDYQGRRFGKYPPGYPLLLSLGVRVGAPWVVNALLGVLALGVIAQLGREIYSPTAGLLAAALGLTSPVFLTESASLLSHPTSLFFTALFLWAFARMIRLSHTPNSARCPAWRFAVIAGLALGYLVLTRPYDAIGVGFPFALYGLVRGLHDDRTLRHQGMIIAAVALLVAMILPIYWYRLTGDAALNPYRLVWPYDHTGFGPDVGLEGHTPAYGLFLARANLEALSTGFLGWPGYLNISFLFLPFLFRPRDTWNYLLLAGFASLVGLHVTYWYYGGHDAGFPRYYYAALPMLLLLTARGIEVLSLALKRLPALVGTRDATSLPRKDRRWPALLYLALVALVLYNGLVFLPPRLGAFRGKSGITAAPLQVVQNAGLTNAIVFVDGVGLWFDFAVFFAANSPTLDTDVVYAIYHNDALARQVRALYPDRACYLQGAKGSTRLLPCPF